MRELRREKGWGGRRNGRSEGRERKEG